MQLTVNSTKSTPNALPPMSQEDLEKLFKNPPPAFGHPLLEYFAFDPTYTNLNHGSYGSCPTPVSAYSAYLTAQIESNPDLWLRLRCQPLMRDARGRLADLIGAERDECVLVTNTSVGVTTVLRNFIWEEGDVIVATTTTYGSITKTVQYLSDIPPHPHVSTFTLTFPTTHASILSSFRTHIQSLVTSHRSGSKELTEGKGKIVAVIDAIVSNPGVLLPWQEMVGVCREFGVWSVVDAAHAIGQEVGIDLGKCKPDFWISNCHKWLLTKKSCAVLYVPFRNQHIIKSSIPTAHTYRGGGPDNFIDQFEWNGTIDFVPFMAVSASLDFRKWLGGELAINNYCHSLALEGGKRLAKVMGTDVVDNTDNNELTLNMVNVYLPLPSTLLPTTDIDWAFKRKLLEQRKVYAAHFYHDGKWIMRASAQVFNDIDDFERVGKVFVEVCKEIVDEFGGQK